MTRPDPPGVCTCDALPAGHNDDQCAMEQWRRACRCSHGKSAHTGGHGRCWLALCCCENYREKATA